MKKIININLSGRVIPIEDTAYEKLQSYIESLRRYFAKEEGRDEIINDIESRIAELMNEKVRKGASCVTDSDVEEIISSMGRPEDFDADTVEPTAGSSQQNTKQEYSYSERSTKRRLYRDSSDKFIGGVCSGIANYLNTDPAIVRILFAIITFGGFGLGFLIYILLWMILPDKDLEGFSGKRLYRNPDDRVIGGVAGGLAAYFNIRTSTIRLIFAAPIVLSVLIGIINGITWHTDFGNFFPNIVFGSLTGTFILAYVILWMVLPEARSNYEKMEMRGEKVDVNSIRQNVQEGMGNVKDRMKQWSEEVKESAQNFGNKAREFANTRGKTFAKEVNETARTSGRGLGHAIGVLFRVFFLFIAGTIAFGLFVAVMALIFGGVAWWPINDFLWTSKWQQAYAWGTLIFFLLVPLVGFLIWLIRRIIGIRSRRSYLGWTFGFLWTIGWVCAILLAASISRDFRIYDYVKTDITTSQPVNGRMTVVVSQPELEYTGRFSWINDGANGWDLSGDTGRLSTVKFNFIKSNDSAYHVTLRKYSYGRTNEDAQRRAEKVQYYINSKDSVLDLGSGYTVDRESKFRGQQVEIEIQIPAGKKIHFDPSVPEKLNPADFKFRKSYRHRTVVNGRVITSYFNDDDYFRFRTDMDYEMGIDGKLKDPAGKAVNNSDYYRYDNDNESDSLNIKQQLEEERRKNKESEKRIKELEKKEKGTKSSTGDVENMNDKDDVASSSPSPVFSLVESFF
jgi:phage shock protein PspC (stress-responsive transcriptional regulator)